MQLHNDCFHSHYLHGHATGGLCHDQQLGVQGLVMMVTDVVDEAAGAFHVWGNTPDGSSVLLRVHDFQPYFYIAGPLQAVRALVTAQHLKLSHHLHHTV